MSESKQLIGISQEDLLYLLGMARLDINRVENGRKKVEEISKKYIKGLGDTTKTIISEINTLKRLDVEIGGGCDCCGSWIEKEECENG